MGCVNHIILKGSPESENAGLTLSMAIKSNACVCFRARDLCKADTLMKPRILARGVKLLL